VPLASDGFKALSEILQLNFPYHGLVAVTPQDAAKGDPHGNIDPLENVFDAHYQFRSLLLRGIIHDSPTEINSADERILTRQVSAEIKAVCLFFPGIRTERIRVCMSAWLAVVCDVDDSLEIMTPKDAEAAVSGAISILQGFSVNLKSQCFYTIV
jgi:hypothetical protein